MKNKKGNSKQSGLSDSELVAKYNIGKPVNFDKALKRMSKTPSPTTLSKSKK